jgi:hypothetical protein
VQHNHLQQNVAGGQPLLHDTLQQGLGLELLLLTLEDNPQGLEHALHLVGLVRHDGVEQLVDGVQNEGDEACREQGKGRARARAGYAQVSTGHG